MTLESLYDFADRNGIPIVPFPLGSLEAMSYLSPSGDVFIGIDPDSIKSSQDEKLKLAHELGHCMKGAFYNVYATCDVWQKQENRANKWAYEHLVTKKDLSEAVENGFQEVWELSELFDVPPEIMARICHWYKYHNMDYQEVV